MLRNLHCCRPAQFGSEASSPSASEGVRLACPRSSRSRTHRCQLAQFWSVPSFRVSERVGWHAPGAPGFPVPRDLCCCQPAQFRDEVSNPSASKRVGWHAPGAPGFPVLRVPAGAVGAQGGGQVHPRIHGGFRGSCRHLQGHVLHCLPVPDVAVPAAACVRTCPGLQMFHAACVCVLRRIEKTTPRLRGWDNSFANPNGAFRGKLYLSRRGHSNLSMSICHLPILLMFAGKRNHVPEGLECAAPAVAHGTLRGKPARSMSMLTHKLDSLYRRDACKGAQLQMAPVSEALEAVKLTCSTCTAWGWQTPRATWPGHRLHWTGRCSLQATPTLVRGAPSHDQLLGSQAGALQGQTAMHSAG